MGIVKASCGKGVGSGYTTVERGRYNLVEGMPLLCSWINNKCSYNFYLYSYGVSSTTRNEFKAMCKVKYCMPYLVRKWLEVWTFMYYGRNMVLNVVYTSDILCIQLRMLRIWGVECFDSNETILDGSYFVSWITWSWKKYDIAYVVHIWYIIRPATIDARMQTKSCWD